MKGHANYSLRAPRTMNDAFGPYTSRNFQEHSSLPAWYWALFIVIVLVFLVTLSAFK